MITHAFTVTLRYMSVTKLNTSNVRRYIELINTSLSDSHFVAHVTPRRIGEDVPQIIGALTVIVSTTSQPGGSTCQ